MAEFAAQPDTSDPAHLHRRHDDADALLHAHARLDHHEQTLYLHTKRLEELIDTQNEIVGLIRQYEVGQSELVGTMTKLNENATKIADVLDAWSSVKGFWTTLKFISAASKIVAPILLFFGAIYAFFKYGAPPPR